MKDYDVIIIGGGAAGFFAAINIAEFNPDLKICILEKNKEGLQKVKISGGGRCNVTHAEFVPQDLVQHYPRGEKELLGPFHQFMTGDTIAWFEKRGVPLKIEDDGRMFPITDSSQTIIDCFINEAIKHQVDIYYGQNVAEIKPLEDNSGFQIETKSDTFHSEKLLVATGSSVKFWKLLKNLGHTIIEPVPSLFTFNINDERIKDIPGVVVADVDIKVLNTNLESEGPLLITHWGMSAPAILKLSAFGALELAEMNYKFQIEVNFINRTFEDVLDNLKVFKQEFAKKTVFKSAQFDLPKRLWQQLVLASKINQDERWADINKQQLEDLAKQLTQAIFNVDGKSTFKEEFVTAGGVDLKEIDFKTFESKMHPNLYFAGEVLNIDAVTGGFNFQNAWTGAYIASKAISETSPL
ncbi:aminoacetone oxidase family FAD-binding enzyme [Hanstruepera neustonica]|uniref:Aminoacetone oxidase family FAD-binding enzyme n=1 Tax=Hanstruepera neustonica TaxID=1445657 RepID=A0A2K1E4E7_9FLAO|nr:NAD(P)/FAD-dependent oxidoreductase [Hanstruepera neustonica]PNQ75159.1 aminoacetone oxidase family FAD-binding enzyme [Hanstruepera neustonica]